MARKWLNLFTGAALSFAVAGNALADEGKITVFAAASLTNAMQDIATQYKKEKGVDVVSSFASSSTLARQIEAGAPADLFISADQKWMDYAVDKKAIDTASRQTLLGNSLVVVAPKASEQKDFTIDSKTNWTSLLNGGRLAVGDPEHVPAGIYAKEALQKLGAWDTLSPKLAPAEDVRGALALVERNEAPLGIVYGSDAVASKGVKVVATFPEDSHKKVEYPVAVVEGHNNATVKAFYDYLEGRRLRKSLNVTDLQPSNDTDRSRMAGSFIKPESFFLAVLFSLPFGIFFAWLLVRCTFPGKALLDSVLHLPLVLPPVVVGYLLLVSMGRRGFIGERLYDWFGLSFAFSWRGAVLAAAVMSFPLMVRAIRLALEGVDIKLEQAARTLGAGRWRVFFTITLPLTLPGIIVGTVLAFARSLGEFGATITFVSNIPGETRTIPSAMYTLIQTPGGESGAARLCIISIALAMISLLISEWLARISRERAGR